MSLGINGNYLEQYERRNNLEITGISDGGSDLNLEEKVIQVLSEIQFNAQVLILKCVIALVKIDICHTHTHTHTHTQSNGLIF